MAKAEACVPFPVSSPSGLARLLSSIAEERGLPIEAAEFAQAVRLCEECRRADAGLGPAAGNGAGLTPRAVPVGCLVVRTPTIRARLKLLELQAWTFPGGPDSGGSAQERAEYCALLVGWVLHHGRSGDDLDLLTEATAPALVADLRRRMGATLAELNAAIGEVVRDLYPEANLLDLWADLGEEPPAQDWAGMLLALASEGCGTAEQLLDAPESLVHHLMTGLRRRQQAEAAAMDAHSSGAPNPDSPKCRAARAWAAFEQALRARRAPAPEEMHR